MVIFSSVLAAAQFVERRFDLEASFRLLYSHVCTKMPRVNFLVCKVQKMILLFYMDAVNADAVPSSSFLSSFGRNEDTLHQ